MTTLEKIGKVIKDLRNGSGLSQEQFCTKCHIDQHYISNIENGQRNLSIEFIERIADYFHLTLTEFFAKVDSIDKRVEGLVGPSSRSYVLQEGFAKFMEAQKLSERTIKKYSSDVPNSVNVKSIINSVTGITDDMYHVCGGEDIEKIIDKVADGEFDRVGQRMYSCGLKKYRDYLESLK